MSPQFIYLAFLRFVTMSFQNFLKKSNLFNNNYPWLLRIKTTLVWQSERTPYFCLTIKLHRQERAVTSSWTYFATLEGGEKQANRCMVSNCPPGLTHYIYIFIQSYRPIDIYENLSKLLQLRAQKKMVWISQIAIRLDFSKSFHFTKWFIFYKEAQQFLVSLF